MRIHFIAIGGSAMHNLALALSQKGDEVTGSDDAIFEPSRSRLQNKGLLPDQEGWFPERITSDIDVIILGMHAKSDNPELLKAKELGLKIYSYPEFIYEHAKEKTRVVIGGSHGKTTITSMILHVMRYHNIGVDYMVGAQLEGFETMVHLTSTNDFMLIEGDEYLSSALDPRPKFHVYKPNIALISGIAWDHINVFPTFENYITQFKIFIDKIVEGGVLVYNEDDANVVTIVEEATNPIRKMAYGLPSYCIERGATYLETSEGMMPLEVFGEHNLSNLNGAKWICQHMGVDEEDFYEAIAMFKGASKRLEKIYEDSEVIVFKDFAHAPSKVKAATSAVKSQYPGREVVAVLELHTYSSLDPDFIKEYKGALDQADLAVVFYSQKALKLKGMPDMTKEQMQRAFQKEDLHTFTNPEEIVQLLKTLKLQQDRVFLFMSSGNYGGIDLEHFFHSE